MIISENEYRAIQDALEAKRELTLTRILGDYKISVEVMPSTKAWNVPMIIQIKQWRRNIYSIKNCVSVEEMRRYL